MLVAAHLSNVCLAPQQIREEATFDEDRWLETLLAGFIRLEQELAEAYDFVSPCFPPHYNIFDSIFQLYHVQFAQVRGVAFLLSCLCTVCAGGVTGG
jgi:hypothetical protein